MAPPSLFTVAVLITVLTVSGIFAMPIEQTETPTVMSSADSVDNHVVTDLLADLFRQTIYNRIENLLLDPGRKSTEKRRIIQSAVENYHQQKMIVTKAPFDAEHEEDIESEEDAKLVELTVTQQEEGRPMFDISELTGKQTTSKKLNIGSYFNMTFLGFWLREVPNSPPPPPVEPPMLLASIHPGGKHFNTKDEPIDKQASIKETTTASYQTESYTLEDLFSKTKGGEE